MKMISFFEHTTFGATYRYVSSSIIDSLPILNMACLAFSLSCIILLRTLKIEERRKRSVFSLSLSSQIEGFQMVIQQKDDHFTSTDRQCGLVTVAAWITHDARLCNHGAHCFCLSLLHQTCSF
jgi:hypothetical protein